MNNAPNIRIEVTEGAQIPDPRDRRLLNAWTLAFCVAVVALVTLCATQPEPYLEIVKFLPDGLIITFEVTVLSLLSARCPSGCSRVSDACRAIPSST